MIHWLLVLSLAFIAADILGLGVPLFRAYPWLSWLPLAALISFPVLLLVILRRGVTSATLALHGAFDRFAFVAAAAWVLANFWGIFMAFPEPQRWGIWGLMVLIVWRIVEALRAKALEAQTQGRLAEEARAQGLRTRLAPHFLFNVLAALKAQLRRDPDEAEATLDHLASLFRQIVEVVDKPRIPLRRELEFVEAYLALERSRLGGRLRVTFEIPEELETHPIPPLSLQVLVENAVKHGVAPLEEGGEVRIGARATPAGLELLVEDPGPGFLRTESAPTGTGTALDTLRLRLAGTGALHFERSATTHRARLLIP